MRSIVHPRVAFAALTCVAVLGAPGLGRAVPTPKLIGVSKAPQKGASVRLRSLYKKELAPLPETAIMTSPALLDVANYKDLADYGKAILAKYPPDKFYFVGIGRTAGPLLAFLKNVSPDIASNFPSSNMNAGHATLLNPAYAENYRAHIEAMIPEGVRNGDRKIVLIDYSGGGSLFGAEQVFKAYKAAGHAMPEVTMLSVGTTSSPGIDSIIFGQSFWTNREEIAEFIGETYDKGHMMHSANGTLSALTRNPKFAEHRRLLFQRMRRDAELDAFLHEQFPTLMK